MLWATPCSHDSSARSSRSTDCRRSFRRIRRSIFTPQQYEDTAREYIKAMRSVQPNGPYHVIGQCQGAYIAFEMARQIEATGQRFGWLGILDAWTERTLVASVVRPLPLWHGAALAGLAHPAEIQGVPVQMPTRKCLIGPASSSIPATNPGAAEPAIQHRDPRPARCSGCTSRQGFQASGHFEQDHGLRDRSSVILPSSRQTHGLGRPDSGWCRFGTCGGRSHDPPARASRQCSG